MLDLANFFTRRGFVNPHPGSGRIEQLAHLAGALAGKLAQIEQQHARLIDPPEPPPGRVERLLRLLQQTPIGDIVRLAAQLEREDFIAIADLLVSTSDEDIARKAVRLGSSVRMHPLVRRAWKLAVDRHPAAGLAELLADRFVATTDTRGQNQQNP